jgi:nitrogen fixation protein FixH
LTTAVGKRSLRWPLAIVGMILLHATAMVLVVLFAARDPSFAVEPNSYQKALAWDAFSARQRASLALGWTVRTRTGHTLDPGRARDIDCEIVDRDGHPVTGATVALLAFPHARGEERTRINLREVEPGKYAGRAAMVRTGLWELRFVAKRAGDMFTATQLHTVEDAP